MMTVKQFVVGAVSTNCYVAGNSKTKEALIIDPGDNAPVIINEINEKDFQPKAVLLTHAHFDHCMAAGKLAEHFGIPVYVHEDDKEFMEIPEYNGSTMMGKKLSFQADAYFHGEKDQLSIAGFEIQVLHTPGHTPGGVCFYVESDGILFSGDTLFCESIGRTDFPKGSMSKLVRSVKEKLFVLPDDTKVLPGHADWTSIGHEKQYNPFF